MVSVQMELGVDARAWASPPRVCRVANVHDRIGQRPQNLGASVESTAHRATAHAIDPLSATARQADKVAHSRGRLVFMEPDYEDAMRGANLRVERSLPGNERLHRDKVRSKFHPTSRYHSEGR